jgi:hypothetical protein
MSRQDDRRKPTAEENALFAVMNGDLDEAVEILEDFYPTELDHLTEQIDQLSDLVGQVMRTKGAR